MPPRFQQVGQGGGFGEWYRALPVVTKYHATTCLVVGVACTLGALSPSLLYFTWRKALFQLQVWRLVTNFLFIGGLGPKFVFRMLWLVMYGVQLESGQFASSTADYLWMYCIGALTCLGLSLLPFFSLPFFGTSMVFMLIYLWSRYYPTANVKIWGLVDVKAVYVPFAFMVVEVAMSPGYIGGGIFDDMAGIIAGHMYYFLKEIEPRRSGRDLIHTPNFLKRLLLQWRVGTVPVQEVRMPNPSAGFRAFSGQGRRLAS